MTWRLREEMLTYEEIVRLTGILAAMGVKKVRLTGGEPLVRPKLHRLVGALKAVPGNRPGDAYDQRAAAEGDASKAYGSRTGMVSISVWIRQMPISTPF